MLLFISFMVKQYPQVLQGQYEVDESLEPYQILQQIAENRHCLLKGEQYDLDKAAMILLENYRNGKLGRISLELPDEE